MPLCLRVVTEFVEHEKHAVLITGRFRVKPAKFLLVFVIGIANRNQCRLAKVYLRALHKNHLQFLILLKAASSLKVVK